MIASTNSPLSLSHKIPEFHYMVNDIVELGKEAGFTDYQRDQLRNAMMANAAAYNTPEKDYRSKDITISNQKATKPMHHMSMVVMCLHAYVANLGSIKELFPTVDQLFTNCRVLLFHDFVEDKKLLDEQLSSGSSPFVPLQTETTNDLKNVLGASRYFDSGMKQRIEDATGAEYLLQKNSLFSLFQYFINQHNDNDFAVQCSKCIWLMSRVYVNEHKKIEHKAGFERLCGEHVLIFNKILDYISNGLSSGSLQIGLDKKKIGASLLSAREDQAMVRIIPFLPELYAVVGKYICIDDEYVSLLKDVSGEKTFKALLENLLSKSESDLPLT